MSRDPTARYEKLLKYRTKSGMLPTFVSGIFLSGAINIFTTEASRTEFFHLFSMILMLISSILFFWEASKIHELQAWYASLHSENKNGKYFLSSTDIWNLKKCKDFYKSALPLIRFFAWASGLLSLPLYYFSDIIQRFVSFTCEVIINKLCR